MSKKAREDRVWRRLAVHIDVRCPDPEVVQRKLFARLRRLSSRAKWSRTVVEVWPVNGGIDFSLTYRGHIGRVPKGILRHRGKRP